MKEALYYSTEKDFIRCWLCPHNCKIPEDKTGICRARKNISGKLYSLTYNNFTAIHLDPVEKKPLYHFEPGSMLLSVGTFGCNFRCLHCQNWSISQSSYENSDLTKLTSADALKKARELVSVGIAYTYNEPLINFEWVLETSKLFSQAGLKNVLVTNGYINEEPWREILKYTDAANIDLKAFDDDFYKKICGGSLEPVLRNIKIMVRAKKHVELTNLLIPRHNDDIKKIEEMVNWIADLSCEIPLHFSRYFPMHKMLESLTPLETLKEAKAAAQKKLKYVYIGNV